MNKIIKGNISLEFNNNWEIRDNKGVSVDKNGKEIEVKSLLGSYASLLPALKRFADLTNDSEDLKGYCKNLENLIEEARNLRVEIIKQVPSYDLKECLGASNLTKEQIDVIMKRVNKFEEVNG